MLRTYITIHNNTRHNQYVESTYPWVGYRSVNVQVHSPIRVRIMTDTEFRKIWKLLYDLWPEVASKRNAAVWRIGLEPYPMAAVGDRVLHYARRNKFFPDLADITAGLAEETSSLEEMHRLERMLEQLQQQEA